MGLNIDIVILRVSRVSVATFPGGYISTRLVETSQLPYSYMPRCVWGNYHLLSHKCKFQANVRNPSSVFPSSRKVGINWLGCAANKVCTIVLCFSVGILRRQLSLLCEWTHTQWLSPLFHSTCISPLIQGTVSGGQCRQESVYQTVEEEW